MSDWLAPVRAALQARDTPVRCFVRDDDAGWADERLLALLDVFDRHAMPIDVAVIPDAVDARLAATLAHRAATGWVHLHQHGRAHTNHEPADRRKCEFGTSRPLDALHSDVAAGRERLRGLLGDTLEPVFTPPWNRCVDGLAGVLAQEGIRTLSRDRSAGRIGHPAVAEVPITVDWFGSTKRVRWSPRQLGAHLASALSGDEAVGLMLHHAVTDAVELARIDALVGLLAHHPMVEPTSILVVATAPSSA